MSSIVKKVLMILLILTLFAGCTSIEESVSKAEAKALVLEKHATTIGKPEIISLEIVRNNYIIEWQNKENKEWGIDQVTKDGEVEMIEATIE